MDIETVNRFLNPDISMMQGVGDMEVTEEENTLAIQMGHIVTAKALKSGVDAVMPAMPDPEIPASVGQFHTFPYAMPAAQQPYVVDDPVIQARLTRVYEQEQTGELEEPNSMVVACASSVCTSEQALDVKPQSSSERIVLYVCGGGFVSSDTALLKWHYMRVSQELGQRVFVPRYHVAPAHVFPRAIHDVYTAFMYLVQQGFQAQDITVLGISAGANIALAVVELLRIQKEPEPSRIVVVAPCVDLTLSMDSWTRNHDKCVLGYIPEENPHSMPRVYYGDVEPGVDVFAMLRHPLLSPLFGRAHAGPPLQIHSGTCDALADDAVALAQHVPHAELITYPGRNHYTILRGKQQLDAMYAHMRRFIQTPCSE
ncbi:hypothetical protein EV180_006191 [Coemansia sp. RSA 518]|nr:hypothetical protein EV180_006191 [Coemansia sp. RSA 518]